jgi:hypothetical protein
MIYPDFALDNVSEKDQHRALEIMESLRGFYAAVPAHDKTSISYQLVTCKFQSEEFMVYNCSDLLKPVLPNISPLFSQLG